MPAIPKQRMFSASECPQRANVLSGRMSSAGECPQRANVLARRMSSAGKCPHQANVLTRRMSSSTTIVFNNLDRKRITRCITLPCVLDTFQFADISTEEPSLPSYHTHRYSQLTSSRVHLRYRPRACCHQSRHNIEDFESRQRYIEVADTKKARTSERYGDQELHSRPTHRSQRPRAQPAEASGRQSSHSHDAKETRRSSAYREPGGWPSSV